MGRESRRIAQAKYDVHRIDQRLLEEIDLVRPRAAPAHHHCSIGVCIGTPAQAG
jgi:hypothetical protein